MKRWQRAALFFGGLVTAVSSVAATVASCSPAATNNPVRSFQNAQKVDVVCLKLGGDAAVPIPSPAVPVPQEMCTPVPPNVLGGGLTYHLFALVTQVTKGEVAVVDLTSGVVVDIDHSTPGLNFLSVGALPTDIAAAPDGRISFVASAAVNMPAIYAIPSNRILGDSQAAAGLPANETPPVPTLTSWPACALPQAPGPIAIVPTSFGLPVAAAADAGAGGSAGTSGGVGYVLAVVLPGDGQTTTAKIVTIDPAPLLRGAGLDAGAGDAQVPPASLDPCPIIGRPIELAPSYPAAQPGAGPAWDNGVPYADAAAILPPLPEAGVNCVNPDSGAGGASLLPAPLAHATAAASNGQTLFVADDGIPVIHVIDFSNPEAPVEREPLVATSATNPSRQVTVGQLAVSPPTRDYKRFLYAVDTGDSPASLMVFDITDLGTSPHVPLTRPYPALNPIQPRDRIIFGAPVVTVAFVQHDFPLTQDPNGPVVGAAAAGLLCNPNPNAGVGPNGPFTDLGADYRANVTNQPEWSNTSIADWPSRLRGIFAFATLSNGTVAVIDVDDWDSPCRRPDPETLTLSTDGGGVPSDIAPIEPSASSASDLDPYHAPNANPPPTTYSDPTSQEAYFPVSAPHRERSVFLLRDNSTTGIHIPYLSSSPELGTLTGGTLSAGGPPGGVPVNPNLLPTTSCPPGSGTACNALADPYAATIGASFATSPNVRFAWEDPTVHVNQTWTVTYEGQLPAYQGFNFSITTPDKFQTLTFTGPNSSLCSTGVEDFDQGTARAQAALAAINNLPSPPLPSPRNLTSRTSDYVQMAEELLSPIDPYWAQDNTVGTTPTESCWDEVDQPGMTTAQLAVTRYNACLSYFQPSENQAVTRDFPILQAYDDHFVIGIFDPNSDPRTISPYAKQETSANNPPLLKLLKCCFSNAAQVNVRTAGEWVAVGTSSQLFHHVTRDPSDQRCVQSCDPTLSLLNARSVGVLPAVPQGIALTVSPFDRNSPAAMRNPMFSYVTFNGVALVKGVPVEQVPARDDAWTFTTNGAFTPLSVNIAASNNSVSPQSMLFIPSISQLAIVDGSSQGLILIDLNLIAEAHTPYF